MDVGDKSGRMMSLSFSKGSILPVEKMGEQMERGENFVKKGLLALLSTTREYQRKGIELGRICRIAVLLEKGGLNYNNSIFFDLAERCISEQKDDGGWIDVYDSVWCASFLENFNNYEGNNEQVHNWLRKQNHVDGSWGRSKRDIGRIPITGLLSYLHPKISTKKSLNWLENEWKKELKTSPVLTYKGAFTLLAINETKYHPDDSDLIPRSVRLLIGQQNEDGGWGPCKGHPTGSDPFCTGVVLLSLLQNHKNINKSTIELGVDWLEKNQLDNGLWPYHYIEEGSAWAFYALSEGYKLLRSQQ